MSCALDDFIAQVQKHNAAGIGLYTSVKRWLLFLNATLNTHRNTPKNGYFFGVYEVGTS